MIGLFGAIYHPVGIAWLVACAKKQGMALGINGVFGSIGSALAPVFVGLMIDFVSWPGRTSSIRRLLPQRRFVRLHDPA